MADYAATCFWKDEQYQQHHCASEDAKELVDRPPPKELAEKTSNNGGQCRTKGDAH